MSHHVRPLIGWLAGRLVCLSIHLYFYRSTHQSMCLSIAIYPYLKCPPDLAVLNVCSQLKLLKTELVPIVKL